VRIEQERCEKSDGRVQRKASSLVLYQGRPGSIKLFLLLQCFWQFFLITRNLLLKKIAWPS